MLARRNILALTVRQLGSTGRGRRDNSRLPVGTPLAQHAFCRTDDATPRTVGTAQAFCRTLLGSERPRPVGSYPPVRHYDRPRTHVGSVRHGAARPLLTQLPAMARGSQPRHTPRKTVMRTPRAPVSHRHGDSLRAFSDGLRVLRHGLGDKLRCRCPGDRAKLQSVIPLLNPYNYRTFSIESSFYRHGALRHAYRMNFSFNVIKYNTGNIRHNEIYRYPPQA